MTRCCRPRLCVPRWLWLWALILWKLWLLKGLLRLCRAAHRDRGRPHDGTVPPWAYRQPDPLIYSQQYLLAQGLAVTWHNPDISLELASAPGVAVDSGALEPNTDYVVVSRVWNGATTAPALGMPVKVSYLEFGIGTTRHDVGLTKVDVAVKGAAGCPAFARVPWRTPAAPGHYCLQTELLWDDDANPSNNMGQHNTDVKALNSPHAAFTFPVRNDRPERRVVTLEPDAYAIPGQRPCDERRTRDPLAQHRPAAWPVPEGWRVTVDPSEAALAPGETAQVTVDITSPDGYEGRQVINVNARSGDELLGGVTLYVDGSG